MTANTTENIRIVLNGGPIAVAKPENLLHLLVSLGIDPERVAVELNREIIRRTAWETTAVGDGAQMEVVQFVGGG